MENWLIVGGGGREYMLAQTLAKQSDRQVYVAPGNPKMNELERVSTVDIEELEFSKLAFFAETKKVQCTVVGPEQPLSAGIVDYFQARDLSIFGPDQQAAKLESSKTFAKQMMAKSGVPTAKYQEFDDPEAALSSLPGQSLPLVIKADGLAAGKGVIIARTMAEAEQAIHRLAASGSKKLLFEDFLTGEEFSLFAMVQGETFITMPVAQDHKRLNDGDKGPNTGGMGAYSPVPHINETLKSRAIEHVIRPILSAMKVNGTPFNGFLYAGLINTAAGIKVIEFNVRMGDPETQVVLPQLQSDLGNLILALKQGQLPDVTWQSGQYYLGTVIASRDYPRNVVNGRPLPVITDPDLLVTYAGVAEVDGQLVSHGGRVMMVTAKADNLQVAQTHVNTALDADVDTKAFTFRHDIGWRALN
ncbi:phosphoribosylamine--glycine ligase [Secundilactobacillus folii]|uniref:Phosphoribosylamine--glycine ligase n=1 Tax=Secundilactobacillus folii TaxID=2678357 RepID=A0A7X2XWP0_9LACO|nr:phosphoribosylamine--glycine ligase [Secundilactobacillus folii]MTV83047.1 phosphoribosylamine--glycine ligase [Secundilactobacillus folii]